MTDDKQDKLPTILKLPTAAEDAHVTNLVDYAAALLNKERAAYLPNIGREKRASTAAQCESRPRKCAIKRLLISAAEQGKSGTLAFPGFMTT